MAHTLDTGTQRVVTTDSSGLYRAVLLPLGTYRVKVEMPNFKAMERTGIGLSAGDTPVVNFALEVGGSFLGFEFLGRPDDFTG